VARLHGIGADE